MWTRGRRLSRDLSLRRELGCRRTIPVAYILHFIFQELYPRDVAAGKSLLLHDQKGRRGVVEIKFRLGFFLRLSYPYKIELCDIQLLAAIQPRNNTIEG